MKNNNYFAEKINENSEDGIFKYLMATLKDSIKGWEYFVNWDKAIGNVKKIEMDLNMLNYLVGKNNVKDEFKILLKERPSIYNLIPILIASRDKDFNILNPKEKSIFNYNYFCFNKKNSLSEEEIESAAEFAEKSGVLNLFATKRIKSVVDYVFGVEVGLDSNGRKNRGGVSMETLVESFIKILCNKYNYEYMLQATSNKIKKTWGINVTVDKSQRRFDFAIINDHSLYLIETNYYSVGGSKLKATAGEYKALYDFLKRDNHKFIWITDGQGWRTAAKPLQETFHYIDYILNLDMLQKGLLNDIIINDL